MSATSISTAVDAVNSGLRPPWDDPAQPVEDEAIDRDRIKAILRRRADHLEESDIPK
jgi:hypothetical protein